MENQENNNFDNSPVSNKQERREQRRMEKKAARKTHTRSRAVKSLVLWVVVVIILGVSVWGILKIAKAPKKDMSIILNTISDTDWTDGNKQAKVILVEYSDFQCPACAAYYPVVKEVVKEYGDRIEFVYRHFPLSQHKNALPAAYASEAAGKQNKFWEMHDVLFEKQTEWESETNPTDLFSKYAESMGLNVDQFKTDMNSSEVRNKVESDLNGGNAANIDHTPTFFINGKEISNPQSIQVFKDDLDQALK